VLLLKLHLDHGCLLDNIANDLDTASVRISCYHDTLGNATLEALQRWRCVALRLRSDWPEYEVPLIWVVHPQEPALLLAK
jgi:hypothetical protein